MNKDKFLSRLKKLNINKMEFANICKVPHPTVNNWGAMRNGKAMTIPPWVEPFLQYYEKALKFDYVTDEICNKIKEVKGT